TYDHWKLRASHPVRSGIYKQFTGGLVVRWVTTSESPLSYVFFVHVCVFFFFASLPRSRAGSWHALRVPASPYIRPISSKVAHDH
ncbi:hypothetical protein COCVIDRAFT_105596, partial [Bipolaris victoriae FI3]